MEVRIDVINHENKLFCTAFYLFVARTASGDSSYRVPELKFDLEDDKDNAVIRNEFGKKRQKQRINSKKTSVFNIPPNSEESALLHQFFVETYNKDWDDILEVGETRVEKTVLMHNQDRNVHGKIFGGLLMRESLELAFVCAFRQGGGIMPRVYHIDDIQFILPVDIGKKFG